ncbi:hypothetical protein ACFWBR_02205 [Streptomyces sp. NPDC060006]|uniref:hypothetical protein n=1 Tax=unclassified Streptomyces TaxID=2593676 RepID=UPI0036A6837F
MSIRRRIGEGHPTDGVDPAHSADLADRAGTPSDPGEWDARSEGWLLGEPEEPGEPGEPGECGELGELGELEVPGREDRGSGEPGDFEDVRGTHAEVGETRVVNVRQGETRVVDVQLGESRTVDGQSGERGNTGGRSGERGNTGVRLGKPRNAAVQPGESGPVHARPGAPRIADARPDRPAKPESVSAPSRSTKLSDAQPGEPADREAPARRGAADPVKALMQRHRELCERAVDPLEIAAGLEAHGVTDRTATRFRHRDVFSLAEEMYARVPRAGDTTPVSEVPETSKARADWAVLALLPGALCAAVVTGLRFTEGRPRLAVTVAGVLVVAFGLRAALSRGPLHATRSWAPTPSTRAWTCWLLAYAILGDGLLAAGMEGGPTGLPTGGSDNPWPIALASVVALTASCAPAVWCAHLFAVRARRRLATSRALEEFAASVRPLLLGVFGLFLCALFGLLALCGAVLGEPAAYAGAGALGALLLLARLLTVHGFTHAPAVVLTAAGVTEAAALLSVFAARLPGCETLAVPVQTVSDAWGPGAVPALVCGAAALVLLLHATRTLTRASAHAARGDTP